MKVCHSFVCIWYEYFYIFVIHWINISHIGLVMPIFPYVSCHISSHPASLIWCLCPSPPPSRERSLTSMAAVSVHVSCQSGPVWSGPHCHPPPSRMAAAHTLALLLLLLLHTSDADQDSDYYYYNGDYYGDNDYYDPPKSKLALLLISLIGYVTSQLAACIKQNGAVV